MQKYRIDVTVTAEQKRQLKEILAAKNQSMADWLRQKVQQELQAHGNQAEVAVAPTESATEAA